MTNTASLFEQEINEVCEKYNVEVSGFGIELIHGLAKNCKRWKIFWKMQRIR